MKCHSCASRLVSGALFCGECGTAVANSAPAKTHPASTAPTGTAPTGTPERLPHYAVDSMGSACEQCAARMAPSDIFCGECGHVARTGLLGTAEAPLPAHVDAGEQVQLEPPPREPFAGPPPPIVVGQQEIPLDVEETRIIGGGVAQPDVRPAIGLRFILQFSTGESVTVVGSGLIGRNPIAEPGERFDNLVRILDLTRSVSKTHLEFGQISGQFFINDRFSGNGTVMRPPDSAPARAEAGRRYMVPRGSRIDIGEQFFVVS